MSGYIAATVPAKPVRVSGTTLFHVALQELDDPLRWVEIAELNKISDPWIKELTVVYIPPVASTAEQTGIFGL
jgi:hypothetical protein